MYSKLVILLLVIVTTTFHAFTSSPVMALHGSANGRAGKGDGWESAAEAAGARPNVAAIKVKARFRFLSSIDTEATKQFERAWYFSNNGTNGREGLVLIHQEDDDRYRVESMGFTGEFRKVTFRWHYSIVAIVHTHPNEVDPRPSEHDRRVAEQYDVPMFTITGHGMYAYDPGTKKTVQVLAGLDWLSPSKWTADVYRRLVDSFLGEGNRRLSNSPTTIGAARN